VTARRHPRRSAADFVDHLVAETEVAWERRGRRGSTFSEAASAALRGLQLHRSLDLPNILSHSLRRLASPARRAFHPAEEVVSLFDGRDFSITLHLWLGKLAQPHAHTWSGAFQVLSGDAVHAWYRFVPADATDSSLLWGERKLLALKVLSAGAIVPVERLETIHGLAHLEAPSLSLAVRSSESVGRTLEFWGRSLAFDVGGPDEPATSRQRCLRALRALDRAAFDAALRELVRELDTRSGVYLVKEILGRYPGQLESLLDLVRTEAAHWGGAREPALLALEEMGQQSSLQGLFERARDARERRLFALLRYAEERRQILELMGPPRGSQRARLATVRDTLAGHLASAGNAVFHGPLADLAQEVLSFMVESPSLAHVRRRLKETYSADSLRQNHHELQLLFEHLRGLPAFRVLFTGARPG
jgi:hypothetical protein